MKREYKAFRIQYKKFFMTSQRRKDFLNITKYEINLLISKNLFKTFYYYYCVQPLIKFKIRS